MNVKSVKTTWLLRRGLASITALVMMCAITAIPQKSSSPDILNEVTAKAATNLDIVSKAKTYLGSTKYYINGTNYCLTFVDDVYSACGLSLISYKSAKIAGDHRITSTSKDIPIGAQVYFDTGTVGHVAIYIGDNQIIHAERTAQKVIISKLNDWYWTRYRGWGWTEDPPTTTINGTSMTKSAGQTIPDGDYWICSALNPGYFMDIEGNVVLSESSNVSGHVWNNTMPEQYDVYTVKYQADGFYEISQKNSEFCLDVYSGSLAKGTNVRMWKRNNSNSQRWSISADSSGYKIQSKCNSWYADINAGTVANGTNVQCWSGNDTKAQHWLFIPYQPEQVLNEGTYKIHCAEHNEFVLDAKGNGADGDYTNQTNIQISDVNRDDNFVLEYDSDGYFRIKESLSGLYLDVNNAADSDFSQTTINVQLYEKSKSRGQLWAVKKVSDDSCIIISKLNGYVLDISAGSFVDGVNVREYFFNDTEAQKWTFKTAKADGDVNADGVVSVADIVMLQKWLLGTPDTTLPSWKNADLCEDEIINSFDLVLLRKLILEQGTDNSEDWIPESELPVGAVVIDEKWTYDIADIETTTSETPLEGWDLVKTDLEKKDSGTHFYVNYPAGFDTSNSVYAKYSKSALKATEDDTSKREVSEASVKSYIYWHWNYLLGSSGPLNDRFVSETSGKKTVSTGQSYTFSHFSAFESNTNLTVSDSSGNCFKYDTGNYDDVSWWWFKLPVYQQTYTDYQKIYTYSRGTVSETGLESVTDPSEIENAANIQKWVKYIR